MTFNFSCSLRLFARNESTITGPSASGVLPTVRAHDGFATENRDRGGSERRECLRGAVGGSELPPTGRRGDPSARASHERTVRRGLGLGGSERGGGGRRWRRRRRRGVAAEAGGRLRQLYVDEGERRGAAAGGGADTVQDPHCEGPRHEGEAVFGSGAPRAQRRHHGKPRLRRIQASRQRKARQCQRLLRAPLRVSRCGRALPRGERQR